MRPRPPRTPAKKKRSRVIAIVLLIVVIILAGGTIAIWYFSNQQSEDSPLGKTEFDEPPYSILTGLEIADASLNNSPVYCIQIPNGSTDGARPQAGLTDAAIVFEAIAEQGITRFAAIFQNPTVSVIGPIRSLRPYYLDWDTPFDCTVTHAGGSAEALAAIASGGQRNLDENDDYMWRESGSSRLWNNLFTSPALLNDFNNTNGYTSSSPIAFPRQTPDDNARYLATKSNCISQIAANESTDDACATFATLDTANSIDLKFTNYSYSHNVSYTYDPETNTYLRYHQDGQPHLSYACPADLHQPLTTAECGDPLQISPSVVIALHVRESTMSDNYHEQITTIGSGTADIFQNGEHLSANWRKTAQSSQIIFTDDNGNEISLVPGQLWISAIPQFGQIYYE